jgi:hypothetical protein
MPLLGDGHARAYVISHPLPAMPVVGGSEDVKAALEPVVEAVGDLDCLVLSVIHGANAIDDRLRSVNREVAVELDHSVLGIDQVGPVHLNFVIVLSARESRSEDEG